MMSSKGSLKFTSRRFLTSPQGNGDRTNKLFKRTQTQQLQDSQNQLKFRQQTVPEDMQLTIEKIWFLRKHSQSQASF